VLGGRLRAVSADGRVLNEMTRGESIGEIALLTGEPRTASVVAVRDSDLVRVSRQAFDEIVAKYPAVMQTIARIVVQRLRAKEQASAVPRTGKCVAVLAAGAGNTTADFTPRLVKALERVGPTLHLSAQRLDTLLNRPGIAAAEEEDAAGIRLTAWLDEQESDRRQCWWDEPTENGEVLRPSKASAVNPTGVRRRLSGLTWEVCVVSEISDWTSREAS